MAHKRRDTKGVLLFSTGLGLSVANHAHTGHPNAFRRWLFSKIDIPFMFSLAAIHVMKGFRVYPRIVVILGTACVALMYQQIGRREREDYTEYQRNMHMMFHLTVITFMTLVRYKMWPMSCLTCGGRRSA